MHARPKSSRPELARPALRRWCGLVARTGGLLAASLGVLALQPVLGDEPAAVRDPAATACAVHGDANGQPVRAKVARISSGHTFVTEDGRMVRLSGIGVPRLHETIARASGEFDPAIAATRQLSELLAAQEVWLFPVTPVPDRHGRVWARVVRARDGLWIEAGLVARGLARVEPRVDDRDCARHLQGIEEAARSAKLGMWAHPHFAVLKATDPNLTDWVGHYVLIEGVVVSTGASGTRRYLNFGKDFRSDFAIILDDKGSKGGRRSGIRPAGRFAAEGFESADIVGKMIRIRGILTSGGGGLMVPTVPEEIEWAKGQP